MKLIRVTIWVHLAVHAFLWGLTLPLLLDLEAPAWTGQLFNLLSGALIIQLGSYHWAMAQWQEDNCEALNWSVTMLLGVLTFMLGLLILAVPQWSAVVVSVAVLALLLHEARGRVHPYIQPWYQRLRWLIMISLVLTQWLSV